MPATEAQLQDGMSKVVERLRQENDLAGLAFIIIVSDGDLYSRGHSTIDVELETKLLLAALREAAPHLVVMDGNAVPNVLDSENSEGLPVATDQGSISQTPVTETPNAQV